MIDLFRGRRSRAHRAALGGALMLAGCVTAGAGTTTATPSGAAPSAGAPATQQAPWRVAALEHVDLWLHGFALLTSDTGRVPFFERGYKQQVTALKRQRNVYSQLDANQATLSARFAANPALTNAQFLAMYFSSFQQIVSATDFFIRSGGDPRAASDPQVQQEIALLAATFRSPADRDWLRLFVQSLQDESTRFFHDYWVAEQQTRGAAYAAFNEQWTSRYYPKLSRFLNNTQQASGQVVLSLPLGGEGRTINDGKQSNMIAVAFPRTVDAAPDAFFVVAHEAVGQVVQGAINDNTTPAEQRSGAANEYVGTGQVRGGALLLQRVLPGLAPAYMRYYLRTLGRTPPAGDPTAAFNAAFPLPEAIVAAIGRQIDIVLGGI